MSGEWKPNPTDVDRAAQVRQELQNIFASDAFKGGKRAQDFLQLVVEHALAGRFDSLRERMLGVEMFGRPVNYDTANDAVVRVKASEVRRRLAQYYRSRETPPPLRIELPPGSYLPQFFFDDAPPTLEPVRPEPAIARPPGPLIPPVAVPAPRPRFRMPRWALVLSGGTLLAAAVGIALFLVNRPTPPAPLRSIVVLPLVNYSGDPKEDYFADGMTDSLIAELGQISSLRVISRTSTMTYKGTKKTIPEIGQELSVDAVIEGSVDRQGNHVRITTQLIDARTDRHIWARTYERDTKDSLQLQTDVAREIADQIDAELTPAEQAHLNRTQQIDPEAVDLYMRGMQEFNGMTPHAAIDYFEKAVDKDSQFGPAHAALADAYGWAGESGRMPYKVAFTKQKAEALKAIALDDSRPEAHLQLAFAALDLDWDWTTCRNELQRALALGPNSTGAHWSYAEYLLRIGRVEEAIAEADIALSLDPVSARAYLDRAYIKYFAGKYDSALQDLQRGARLPHTRLQFNFALGDIYAEKALYPEAAQKFRELDGGPHATGHLGNVYARQGRITDAQSILEELKQEVENSGLGRYEIALIYAGLGDKNNAFAWLERSYDSRDKGMLYLKVDPCIDPLREDPRLQDLIKRIAFPAA
jgi:TolB-like protein/Tfp pilus assembly protein PilF